MPTENVIEATSNKPQILVAKTLAGSNALLLNNTGGKAIVVNTASVVNTSAADCVAYLSVTKAGGGTARIAAVKLRGATVDEPGESAVVDELFGFCFGAGDSLSGYATSADSVDVTLSGAVSS